MTPAASRPPKSTRVDPARMPHLLGHVDRVIEADQGVEREDGAGQDGRRLTPSLNSKARAGSPAPVPSVTTPIKTISNRPVISMHVNARLSLTDSEMP